jgi:hypothetical protein
MFKVERLAQGRELPMAATRPIKARMWVKVGERRKHRLAVAERIALLARIDNPNAIIRIGR